MVYRTALLVFGLAATALTAGAGKFALAQQPTGDVIGELANNEGIFVDGKTFKIARGKAKGDPAAQIAKLGAKEVGPGAIVFRYNDKLYMVEGTPAAAAAGDEELPGQLERLLHEGHERLPGQLERLLYEKRPERMLRTSRTTGRLTRR